MVILQIRKLKKLDEWVPHELTKNQKNHCFEVSSLITCNNNKTFLDWIVMYNESGFYRTSSDDQLSVLTEKKLQSPFQNLHEKKVMVTVWWSGASLIHCSFLNPSKTITSEKYAQHQWDALKIAKPATGTGQQKGPNSSQQSLTAHCTTRAPKVERMSYYILSLLPYSPDHLPSDYHLFKYLHNFLKGKWVHSQQEAENVFQELLKSWSTYSYAIGINIFLIGKNVLIVMVPILINKDVFEPSNNDLKIMIRNHNYFCTKPILLGRNTAAAAAKLLQSYLTLCDPIDGSPPGSPVLGFSRQEHWSGLPFPSPMH